MGYPQSKDCHGTSGDGIYYEKESGGGSLALRGNSSTCARGSESASNCEKHMPIRDICGILEAPRTFGDGEEGQEDPKRQCESKYKKESLSGKDVE